MGRRIGSRKWVSEEGRWVGGEKRAGVHVVWVVMVEKSPLATNTADLRLRRIQEL